MTAKGAGGERACRAGQLIGGDLLDGGDGIAICRNYFSCRRAPVAWLGRLQPSWDWGLEFVPERRSS